jgi:hypothetical protein
MGQETESRRVAKGLTWILITSLLLGLLWFTFVIVWLFFYAFDYTFYQNLAILMSSTVMALGSLIIIWLWFGLSLSRRIRGIGQECSGESTGWLGWRTTSSIMIWIAWFGFLITWLFFFAGGYNHYQNASLIVVSLLIAIILTAILRRPLRESAHS